MASAFLALSRRIRLAAEQFIARMTARSSSGEQTNAAEPDARARKEDASKERFGCERCWPADADAAHEARRTLTGEADLIEESHFYVRIRACPNCSQRFISVFTETIDWDDGDDPQYWALLPLTAAEAADLIQQGSSLTEATLNALGRGRKCLQHDHPKGMKARSYWGTSLSVRHHD
jgi:hypothetical protein